MNVGRTIFAQLMDHLPAYEFQKCVDRYDGDHKFRGFSCGDQFLALAFAQLTYRESLRDIEACLRAVSSKLIWVSVARFPNQLWPMRTRLMTGESSPISLRC